MATPQQMQQAAAIIESQGWTVRHRRGQWVIEDERGRRVWPVRASEMASDPWIAAIDADTAFQSGLPNRGAIALQRMRELERGVSVTVTREDVTDPDTGDVVTINRWLASSSELTQVEPFDSAGEALDDHRRARLATP